MVQLLLVDDERELLDPLQRALRREGYAVDTASDGVTGASLVAANPYDLLILDWMLPGRTGLEICRDVRSRGLLTPVLILTAKDTVDDRVLGLDAGADDYLVKPFELRELLARVRALLRRGASEPGLSVGGARLSCDDLQLDPENQLAYRGGRTIELAEKEARLLEYLMRHAGQLLSHEQIYDHLWPEGDGGSLAEQYRPTSNALAAQMRLLRRKIEAIGEVPLIHSVYGKGYRFGG